MLYAAIREYIHNEYGRCDTAYFVDQSNIPSAHPYHLA